MGELSLEVRKAVDAHATALMVTGADEGPALARRLGLDALFVARAGDRLRAIGTGFFDDAGATV